MDRAGLEKYIMETYSADADFPWADSPQSEVFRHYDNRKWFALVMTIPREKVGLQGNEILNVVNLKCEPAIIGSLCAEPGFFPAYHMNKANWITIALDGSVPDDKIKILVDRSFELTATKLKKKL